MATQKEKYYNSKLTDGSPDLLHVLKVRPPTIGLDGFLLTLQVVSLAA